MNRKLNSKIFMITLPVLIVIGFMTGCTVKSTSLWGDPDTGLILEYRLTDGQILNYESSGYKSEINEIMGQEYETETTSSTRISFKSVGMKEEALQLEATVEDMSLDIESPQMNLSPDLSAVIGKSFVMSLSSLGKELDVSGAEGLEYELGPIGTRNLLTTFEVFFPDLPENPIKIGESWTTTYTINDKNENVSITVTLQNANTVDGFEVVDGLDCIRIKADVSGTLVGEGSQGGARLDFHGDIIGNDTWYFAYKEGVYVSMVSNASVDLTIEVSGPQTMTIPGKQEMQSELKLVK
jgi:hypothetical protein